MDDVLAEEEPKAVLKERLSIYYLGCKYPMEKYYKTMLDWVIVISLLLLITQVRSKGTRASDSTRIAEPNCRIHPFAHAAPNPNDSLVGSEQVLEGSRRRILSCSTFFTSVNMNINRSISVDELGH